jgi:copper(I)-binding protein
MMQQFGVKRWLICLWLKWGRAGLAALLAVGFLGACGPAPEDRSLLLEEAWVRAAPPGMKMTAGFGQWVNKSADPIEIMNFSSPDFQDVSLHLTVNEQGVSRMNAVASLTVPSGGTVEMAPGGYHLMLMQAVREFAPGDRVILEVTDAAGSAFAFELPVERR